MLASLALLPSLPTQAIGGTPFRGGSAGFAPTPFRYPRPPASVGRPYGARESGCRPASHGSHFLSATALMMRSQLARFARSPAYGLRSPSPCAPRSVASLPRPSLLPLPRNASPVFVGLRSQAGSLPSGRGSFSSPCGLADARNYPLSASSLHSAFRSLAIARSHGSVPLLVLQALRSPSIPSQEETLCRSVSSLPFLDIRPSRLCLSVLPHGDMFMRSCFQPCGLCPHWRGAAGCLGASPPRILVLLVPRSRTYFALRAPLLVSASLPHLFSATALTASFPPRFPDARHSPTAHCAGVVPRIRIVTLPRGK